MFAITNYQDLISKIGAIAEGRRKKEEGRSNKINHFSH